MAAHASLAVQAAAAVAVAAAAFAAASVVGATERGGSGGGGRCSWQSSPASTGAEYSDELATDLGPDDDGGPGGRVAGDEPEG